MLTYSLDKKGAIPLYEQLYRAIKKDITIGILKAEGYIYSQAKKGFFVSEINPHHPPVEKI